MDDARDGGGKRLRRAELVHELRTPLCVAIGRGQMLKRRIDEGAERERLAAQLAIVMAALDRLSGVIDRIDQLEAESDSDSDSDSGLGPG